ncbi:hypothetical protein JMJ35_005217 [Cladonia borealis]|uniref:Uncharacterized protein n=1 Tax=Cladonia borealis TaxID=184061 RepID=A0AA39R1V1_9LECA|nr:hypothetical protein JMJ35_005217 [Cladonia borealis]
MDRGLNDVFRVPEDGHILDYEKAHEWLPTYQSYGISPNFPLTLTDCHLAIMKIIRQARLIGFEIARKQMPLLKRTSKKIMLQGDPRKFDIILARIPKNMIRALKVKSIWKINREGERLKNVLENPVKAHHDFGASSVILKRSLLRIEKNFGQTITEPLKKAMINKSTPKFPVIIGHASRYKQEILTACRIWSNDIEAVCTIVKSTEGWREASELSKKIDDLLSRARSIGWKYWLDPSFKELDLDNVFNRADGPSSVIAYMEGVLDSAKVPRGISNQSAGETQGTLLVGKGEEDGSFGGFGGVRSGRG